MRIAFTGTHGTGKTTLSTMLSQSPIWGTSTPLVLGSTTRLVQSLGFGVNYDSSFEAQAAMLALRYSWELESWKSSNPNVVGERCLLDEFVYTKFVFSQVRDTLTYTELQSFWGLLKSFRSIIQSFYERRQFWDRVFRLPITTLSPLEPDEVRIDDKVFQKDIDEAFTQCLTEDFPGLKRQVILVPDGTFKEMSQWIEGML